MSLCSYTSDTGAHSLDGCLEPRRATGMSPSDHQTDRPSRPPYTPPTNSGGGYVARRSAGKSPRTGCSRFLSLAALSLLRQTSDLGTGEARAGSPYNHLFPGARHCGERQGTRTSRPLCHRPLLLFYPCRKGWGTPQHGFSQSRISSKSWTQPSRVSLRSTRRTPPRSRTLAPGKPGNRNRREAGARVR